MVLSPDDDSVVSTPEIPVSGMTVPDSYLTVNGIPIVVEGDGSFTTTVVLEEGPNLIEVIASDGGGDEQSAVLAIIYIAA
jgi:bacillopeptidase F